MKETYKKRIVNGIIVMSNPYIIFGTILMMLLLGWLAIGELSTILWICVVTYLILSIVGGLLVKSLRKNSQKGS